MCIYKHPCKTFYFLNEPSIYIFSASVTSNAVLSSHVTILWESRHQKVMIALVSSRVHPLDQDPALWLCNLLPVRANLRSTGSNRRGTMTSQSKILTHSHVTILWLRMAGSMWEIWLLLSVSEPAPPRAAPEENGVDQPSVNNTHQELNKSSSTQCEWKIPHAPVIMRYRHVSKPNPCYMDWLWRNSVRIALSLCSQNAAILWLLCFVWVFLNGKGEKVMYFIL